jgi:UDP-2,3-diacylglucosamine pyrophosphatase LpxH
LEKRKVEVAVISDIHLGTYGCRAKECYQYLKSIKPNILILNGDIIDVWQFRKRYFPKSHLQVIKQLFSMASKGTKIYYITGNHDEAFRKFTTLDLGNILLANKLVLELNGKKAWFFHGDVFDASIQNAKWIAKLGGWGYDLLILINSLSNWCLDKMGKERYSFSKKIKNSVKQAVSFISNFENTAAELAINNQYDYVICGHIHQPKLKKVSNAKGSVMYLNSGDWIENLSALEYNNKAWTLYEHQNTKDTQEEFEYDTDLQNLSVKQLMDVGFLEATGI